MDKVKKYLEAYVQWLALALGVLFLGWVVYGYVVQKPVSTTVGPNANVLPGDVYRSVWDGPGTSIANDLNSHTVPPGIGPSKDWAEAVRVDRDTASSVPGIFATPWTPPSPLEDTGFTQRVATTQGSEKIVKLPDAPPLTNLLYSKGHSNVPAPQPPLPAGGAAAPQSAKVQPVDRNWLTIAGTFPTGALAKSFKDVGIAPGTPISNTAVLRVMLIREERMVDGSWGPDTEIQPLEINPLDPLPAILAPFNIQTDYLANAEKNFIPIARPPFYQVLQGDVWYEPGTPNPKDAQTVMDIPFDPTHPLDYTGDLSKLLPSERDAYDKAKKDQAAKDALKSRSTNPRGSGSPSPYPPAGDYGPSGPPGGPGGTGGTGSGSGRRSRGGGGGVADDPQRLAGDYGNPPMLMPPNGYGPPPGYGGGPRSPYGGPPMQGMQPPGQPAVAESVPTGSFDPSQQVEFKVWVHDPTVQAGKTYRYQMKYFISNPIARTTGLCAPALSQQFYIVSALSAWTDPISVESDTNFYAVALKHGIEFHVFKWKDGLWQMQDVTANPGDMVGSTVTDPATNIATDFTTGWTLVDIREDPSNSENRVVILVSDNGTILTKELSDAHSPEYRKLWLQANQNKPAVAKGN